MSDVKDKVCAVGEHVDAPRNCRSLLYEPYEESDAVHGCTPARGVELSPQSLPCALTAAPYLLAVLAPAFIRCDGSKLAVHRDAGGGLSVTVTASASR